MARRWYVPLLALPVAVGTVVAVLEGVASASPGLTHPAAPTAAVQRVFPGTPMISTSGGARPGLANGTMITDISSPNWAGYVVSGRNGSFRTVSASWTAPKVNCSGVTGHRYSSFWVGLDGFTNNNVEQLGTEADCQGRTPVYSAWWEMFPLPSVNFPNAVHPGDHMFASVTFRGAGRFALFIRDSTRQWSRTIITSVANAPRTSAEVIAEAPALKIRGRFVTQNLADFGTVRWTGSRVNGSALKNIGQRIRITMTEVNTPRIRATASPVGAADAFTNSFVRCC